MSAGSWGSLLLGVATVYPMLSSAKAWWQERARREQANAEALLASLEKEREELITAQKEEREFRHSFEERQSAALAADRRSFEERLSAALAADRRSFEERQSAALAADRRSFEERQSAALAAASSENRAALADDRRAFEERFGALVKSQAKSWW